MARRFPGRGGFDHGKTFLMQAKKQADDRQQTYAMRSNWVFFSARHFRKRRSDETCRKKLFRQRTDTRLGRCLTVILPRNSVRRTHWGPLADR